MRRPTVLLEEEEVAVVLALLDETASMLALQSVEVVVAVVVVEVSNEQLELGTCVVAFEVGVSTVVEVDDALLFEAVVFTTVPVILAAVDVTLAVAAISPSFR